jgi:hypothetical protein
MKKDEGVSPEGKKEWGISTYMLGPKSLHCGISCPFHCPFLKVAGLSTRIERCKGTEGHLVGRYNVSMRVG